MHWGRRRRRRRRRRRNEARELDDFWPGIWLMATNDQRMQVENNRLQSDTDILASFL